MKHLLEDSGKLDDAHLVASARKLLEACKAVQQWIIEYRGHMGMCPLELLTKAIEEAEGES